MGDIRPARRQLPLDLPETEKARRRHRRGPRRKARVEEPPLALFPAPVTVECGRCGILVTVSGQAGSCPRCGAMVIL